MVDGLCSRVSQIGTKLYHGLFRVCLCLSGLWNGFQEGGRKKVPYVCVVQDGAIMLSHGDELGRLVEVQKR
jgi:hypothetical protein